MFSVPWLVSPGFLVRIIHVILSFPLSRCSPFDIYYPWVHMSTSGRNFLNNDVPEFCTLSDF